MDTYLRNRIHYFIDFLLVIIVIICIIATEFLNFNQILKLGFHCQDPAISYKFNGDTVTTRKLVLITVILPFIVIYLVEWMSTNRWTSRTTDSKRGWIEGAKISYISYFVGCSYLLLLVNCLKSTISEPRPHFLDTCQPFEAKHCNSGTYFQTFTCKNPDPSVSIRDVTRSFPSGHAALSSYLSIFLICYLNNRLVAGSRLVKWFGQIVFLFWAIFICASRVADHRHHWWDVSIGFILGSSFAAYNISELTKTLKKDHLADDLSEETALNDSRDENHTSDHSNFVCNITRNSLSKNKFNST